MSPSTPSFDEPDGRGLGFGQGAAIVPARSKAFRPSISSLLHLLPRCAPWLGRPLGPCRALAQLVDELLLAEAIEALARHRLIRGMWMSSAGLWGLLST